MLKIVFKMLAEKSIWIIK